MPSSGRNHTVPVPAWWSELATSTARDRGLTHPELARQAAIVMGVERPPSASTISRCLSGTITPIELMDAVSVVLRLPPPVLVAESRQEAIALQRERLLFREERKLSEMTAETTRKQADHQTGGVGYGTDADRGDRGKPKRGRVGGDRT